MTGQEQVPTVDAWRRTLLGAPLLLLVLTACEGGAPSSIAPGNGSEESDSASQNQSEQPVASTEGRPARTFEDGDYIVGEDIRPGTYRLREAADLCYWERLSGFGGSLDEIIANNSGSGFFTVTIKRSDAGFSSSGCGTWTTDLSAVVSRRGPIEDDGVFIVGTDIAPGTWRSSGGGGFACYVARLAGFGGTLNEVISNELSQSGRVIVTLKRSDEGFETNGCGTWTKVD